MIGSDHGDPIIRPSRQRGPDPSIDDPRRQPCGELVEFAVCPCGCSSMVEQQASILSIGVRFPVPAPNARHWGSPTLAEVIGGSISSRPSPSADRRRPSRCVTPETSSPVTNHDDRVPRGAAYDIAVIGAGPAGAATAIRAAGSGVKVIVFERDGHGRDKVCGDGLTPRAIGALNELKIDLSDAHHIVGLRMIANKTRRELDWPTTNRFPNHGAVWPRRRLDAALMDAAVEAGAELVFETEAMPVARRRGAGHRRRSRRTVLRRRSRRPRQRRAGRRLPPARRRPRPRRTVRSRHSDLRRVTPTRRRTSRGLPHVEGRTRNPDPRLRLDVPRRRRHREHRRRSAVDDEGVQEAQPQHPARRPTGRSSPTNGTSDPTSNVLGPGGSP